MKGNPVCPAAHAFSFDRPFSPTDWLAHGVVRHDPSFERFSTRGKTSPDISCPCRDLEDECRFSDCMLRLPSKTDGLTDKHAQVGRHPVVSSCGSVGSLVEGLPEGIDEPSVERPYASTLSRFGFSTLKGETVIGSVREENRGNSGDRSPKSGRSRDAQGMQSLSEGVAFWWVREEVREPEESPNRRCPNANERSA